MDFAPNTPSTTVDVLIDTCKKMHKQVQKFGKFLSTVAPDENVPNTISKAVIKKKKPVTTVVMDASKVVGPAMKTKKTIDKNNKKLLQPEQNAEPKRGRGRPKKQIAEK